MSAHSLTLCKCISISKVHFSIVYVVKFICSSFWSLLCHGTPRKADTAAWRIPLGHTLHEDTVKHSWAPLPWNSGGRLAHLEREDDRLSFSWKVMRQLVDGCLWMERDRIMPENRRGQMNGPGLKAHSIPLYVRSYALHGTTTRSLGYLIGREGWLLSARVAAALRRHLLRIFVWIGTNPGPEFTTLSKGIYLAGKNFVSTHGLRWVTTHVII